MAFDGSDLSILIKAKINNDDLKDVNLSIDKLSSNPNLHKLNLKIDIDTNALDSLNKRLKEIQTQFGGLGGSSNKPFSIPTLDTNEIENRIQRINNSLDRLKVNKDKVFADSRVSTEVDKLKDMETAYRKGAISSKDYALQMDNVRTKVTQVSGALANVNKDGYSFTQMIELAAKKIAIWGVSTSLVYGSFRQLKEGISYIADLDNSLNQIRIVTGQSQEQVEQLAQSYNKLAKSMSVSTKEVADQAVDLYRQGLQGVDVDERMQAIIKYAKISSLSLAESNNIITATMNATGESAQKVIDIFSYLGDATASGADEIGQAMQKVASMNDGIGVSMEKAASWIAVISSKTREGASQIGTSLKFEALVA